jgi:hypothetical protein
VDHILLVTGEGVPAVVELLKLVLMELQVLELVLVLVVMGLLLLLVEHQ